MSLATDTPFAVDALPVDGIESGTSVLLTGADEQGLGAVFNTLLAPRDDERAVVLATDADGRSVRRELDGIERGAGDRSTVLTATGSGRGENVESIDDVSDLTEMGMQLSAAVASAQQETERFRSGIYLCSSVCQAVDDTRSVYRFLNSNFLTELRRGDGIGVCAIDTSAEVGSDVSSIVAGLETSFNARIDVTDYDGRSATLSVSGLDYADDTVEVTL